MLKINVLKLFIIYFLFFISFALQLNAQVGINTDDPDVSSILDINSTDKGMLVPRVELQSTTDANTILNPTNSLLVFNKTAINDIAIGYYYWSTPLNKWIKILDQLDKPGVLFATFANSKTSVNTTASTNSQVFNYSNISFNSITGSSFSGNSLTLPPGNYIVESSVYIGRNNFDHILRVGGTSTGIKGTVATVKTQAEIVSQNQMAVFSITVPTVIDFIALSSAGGATIPVDPSLSFLKITKF